MLKGNTRIEMTNVNTGEVTVVEKENMITNAVEDILNICEKEASSSEPIYQSLFGGLYLFDAIQDEDPNLYFPKNNSNLVGAGAYNYINDKSSSYYGTFNKAESTVDLETRTVKYVYDFKTSEANGTINSICLTNVNAGLTYPTKTEDFTRPTSFCTNIGEYYFDPYYRYISNLSPILTIKDSYPRWVYSVNKNLQFVFIKEGGNIKIQRKSVSFNKFNLSTIHYASPTTIEKEVLIPYKDYTFYFYSDEESKLYFLDNKGNLTILDENLEILKEFKYDINTPNDIGGIIIINNYLYLFTNHNQIDLIRINLLDNTLEKQSSLITTGNYELNGLYNINNLIYILETNSNSFIYDLESKKIIKSNFTIPFWGLNSFSKIKLTGSNSSRKEKILGYFNGYLATINNLPVPLIKTNEYTMKIIYTLREEA